MHILTNEQMQRVDADTFENICPGLELMERAGRGCAQLIIGGYSGEEPSGATIFAGAGNNGGDGFVIARYLAETDWEVSVHLLKSGDDLTGDAADNYERLAELADERDNIVLFDAAEEGWLEEAAEDIATADVVVDAIFGTGISGAPRGAMLDAIRLINAFPGPVVAIDIPSGVNGSTGETPGEAVMATETLTIGAPKVGSLFHPGRAHCAEVQVVDIGFPDALIEKHAGPLHLLDLREAAARLPFRAPDTHKFDAGTAVVVAGSREYRGAALLCGEAALRGGAGMVYLGVPASIRDDIDTALPEVITVPLPETEAGTVAPAALDVLGPYLERAHAVGVGPGIGRHPETAAFVEALLAASELPAVLDADAIAAFNGRADALGALASGRELVLTPHSGELARLLGEEMPEAALERIDITERIAGLLGLTLVHKGAPTLVGHSGEGVYVNTSGSSALATGGTGDVLTGFVASFLAQGAAGLDAALVACLLHGRAGDTAAEEMGKRGVIASDLMHTFGPVMVALEALAGD
jgi:NAD(P)H-hydrate epimerase